MTEQELPEFQNNEDAFEWLYALTFDECIDNSRIFFYGDKNAENEFEEAAASGCCGSMERDVLIGGQKARVGCNYGH